MCLSKRTPRNQPGTPKYRASFFFSSRHSAIAEKYEHSESTFTLIKARATQKAIEEMNYAKTVLMILNCGRLPELRQPLASVNKMGLGSPDS